MVQEFSSGDALFFNWMDCNPNGYVLNTKRSGKSSYAYFHKSDCGHISSPIDGNESNPYTTKDYIKICSTNSRELLDWIRNNRKNVGAKAVNCRDCKPNVNLNAINSIFPSELDIPVYAEGIKKKITVNSYERDPKARKKCLEYFGYSCAVCGINFKEKYKGIEKNPIHVHHLNPISKSNGKRKVDPIKDLIPVCPNCHTVIHSGPKLYPIERVKEMLQI
jgi:predicted HNH restriction endonuclease